jgi:DNA-binding MarR family transcriptional regulator
MTLAEPPRAQAEAAERERELAQLGRAFRGVWRSLGSLRGRDTHLGAGELSHAQFELLIELDEHGELSASELATAARMAPGTVTQMLEHLALCGQVERARSQEDRRVVVSRLTAQGRERVERKRAGWKERWEQALGDLDCAQLQAAAMVLERLDAMVQSMPALSGAETPDRSVEKPAAGALGATSPLL